MPLRKKDIKIEEPKKPELAEESKIAYNINYLKNAPDEDIEGIKKIVCAFYKEGKCPACDGCGQPDSMVLECRDEYLDKINNHPQLVWTADFDKALVRPKQKITEVIEMGLSCDKCYMADACPLYKPGYLCGIDWEEEGEMTPKKVIAKLIDIQFKRVNRGSKIEEMDGGVPDQTLSTEIDRLTALTQTQNDFNLDKFELSIKGQTQNAGTGLLASLLGRPVNTNHNNQVQDVTHKELPFEPAIEIPVLSEVEKREKASK